MSGDDGDKLQRKADIAETVSHLPSPIRPATAASPTTLPTAPPPVVRPAAHPPASPAAVRARNRAERRPRTGVASVLLIDALALLLVLASGPAAYLWLDQSHPSPFATAAASEASPGPSAVSDASPGSGGSSEPGTSPGGQSSPSIGPSPKLVYGNGTWTQTDPLPRARWATASTLLHDGRVLVVGGTTGLTSTDAVATATVFDPATGHWSAVTDMLQPRAYPMAVTLADGSVLVAGGSRNTQPLDTAERYNPDNGTWVAAGRLNLPRAHETLTLLNDGRVLAAGGGIEGGPGWASTASAEIYDPKNGVWSILPPMSVARVHHTATLLPDGEVLIAGGATTYFGEAGSVTASAEIFNPHSNSWRVIAPMSHPRYVGGAALLNDGRVLVAGGWYATTSSDPSHQTAEIYDPATDRWTAAAPMANARAEFGLVALPDGRVLAAGGVDPGYKVQASSELYDPTTGLWQLTGSLGVATVWPAMQALPDGRVLVAGGLDSAAAKVNAVCELYAPPPR
jgi:hypothetical protein